MFKCISLIILTLSSSCAYAFKILLVFPVPTKSHAILGEGYVRNLEKAGHDITYITPFPMKNISDRVRQIDVSDNLKFMEEEVITLENVLNGVINLRDDWIGIIFANNVVNHTLWNPGVRQLILDPEEQFDVVIVEWLYSELNSGLAAVFNCPLIWSSSIEPHNLALDLIDEEPNPAYTATLRSFVQPPLTFLQRVQGLCDNIYMKYLKWLLIEDEIKMYEEAFGPALAVRGRSLPNYEEVKYNASLMLGNSHVSTGFPIRLPQNYKPIAGYHIEDVKPLPKDIQKIMDRAQHGVIYFSMGTMLKSASMPDVLKKGLLEMFGALKQTVIWKFEKELLGTPKNVYIMKWAPQASILAHPNCILFITHCGLLSMTEAVSSSVPIIGIPMFADQFINIERAVNKGFAKRVTFSYDLPSHLKPAIEEMIHDKRYRQQLQELSFIYRHRPVPPGAELVHWVEHVVHTRGAPHLRSPAIHVPFYQKYYLDLATIILLSTLFVRYIFKRIMCIKTDSDKKNR